MGQPADHPVATSGVTAGLTAGGRAELGVRMVSRTLRLDPGGLIVRLETNFSL